MPSRQDWKCGDCKDQLNAWFEVDHIVRLEYGGSNHVDNLVALCRDCHGRKTAMENHAVRSSRAGAKVFVGCCLNESVDGVMFTAKC